MRLEQTLECAQPHRTGKELPVTRTGLLPQLNPPRRLIRQRLQHLTQIFRLLRPGETRQLPHPTHARALTLKSQGRNPGSHRLQLHDAKRFGAAIGGQNEHISCRQPGLLRLFRQSA